MRRAHLKVNFRIRELVSTQVLEPVNHAVREVWTFECVAEYRRCQHRKRAIVLTSTPRNAINFLKVQSAQLEACRLQFSNMSSLEQAISCRGCQCQIASVSTRLRKMLWSSHVKQRTYQATLLDFPILFTHSRRVHPARVCWLRPACSALSTSPAMSSISRSTYCPVSSLRRNTH